MVALRAESMLAWGVSGGGTQGGWGIALSTPVHHPEIGGHLMGPDKSALPACSGTPGPRLLPVPEGHGLCQVHTHTGALQSHGACGLMG